MYRSVWNAYHESVCSLSFYNKKDIQFFRSTGFRYENYLISYSCQDEIDKACYVVIKFFSNNPGVSPRSIRIPMSEFKERIKKGVRIGLFGILILPIRNDELKYVPSVNYARQPQAEVGTPIAMLSCSRLISELYMKTGLISSYIIVKGEKYIFIESSFEPGNSGAPLVNVITGKVIGVMVDCFPSPAQNHKKLKRIIEDNIRVLNDATGKWAIGDIDPAQVLTANQYMIKHLAKEIYLCSHRNFGFAVPVEKVSRYIRNIKHKSQFAICNESGL